MARSSRQATEVARAAGALAVAIASVLVACAQAGAGERRPVPAVTIYPGDVIREEQLVDADFPDAVASAAFATARSMLVGKVARATLLPGHAIPANAVGEPRLVTIGARVRLVYEEDGLLITTYASAMQAGVAGDFISVRNMESGLVIGGTIRADGSIRVGPG